MPTAGNAIEWSLRSAAMRKECAVELLQGARRGFSSKLHAGRMDHEASAEIASAGDRRAADGNAANRIALSLNGLAALAANRSGHSPAEAAGHCCGIDDETSVSISVKSPHIRMIFSITLMKSFVSRVSDLLRKLAQCFLVIAEHNIRPPNHHGTSDQVWVGGHHFQGLIARRRSFTHLSRAVKFVARIQEFAMVSFADELVQLVDR